MPKIKIISGTIDTGNLSVDVEDFYLEVASKILKYRNEIINDFCKIEISGIAGAVKVAIKNLLDGREVYFKLPESSVENLTEKQKEEVLSKLIDFIEKDLKVKIDIIK